MGQGAYAADDLAQDLHLPALARTAQEAARVARVTAPTDEFTTAEPFETNQGGAATVVTRAISRDMSRAFSHPSASLTAGQELQFSLGRAVFKKLWVSSPSSTKRPTGLARFTMPAHVCAATTTTGVAIRPNRRGIPPCRWCCVFRCRQHPMRL